MGKKGKSLLGKTSLNWGLCPNDGHADPPPLKKDHLKNVIKNGAKCSEQNGKNNKKILRFFFFKLSSKTGVIFSQK